MQVTGVTGFGPWRNLLNYPNWQWWQLLDKQTGQLITLYKDDTIIVIYGASGYSEQWQFQGPFTSIMWKRVPNTLMYKGNPVKPLSNIPATPAPGAARGGGGLAPPYWNYGGSLFMRGNTGACYGVSEISVSDGNGGGFTGYGVFVFPC